MLRKAAACVWPQDQQAEEKRQDTHGTYRRLVSVDIISSLEVITLLFIS